MFKGLKWLVILVTLASFNLFAEEEVENGDDNNRTKTPPELSVMDTDGDGKVSAEEFNQYRGTRDDDEVEEEESEDDGTDGRNKLSAFASFDKDKDGFVTQEELNAHAKYSNPGNGTGTLKGSDDEPEQASPTSGKGKSGDKGNHNSGKDKGGKDKGSKDKGDKGKDK